LIIVVRGTAGAAITQTLGTLSIGAQTLQVMGTSNSTGALNAGLTFGATTLTGNALINVNNRTGGTGNVLLTLGQITTGSNNLTLAGPGNVTINGTDFARIAAGTVTTYTAYTGPLPTSGGTSADTDTLSGSQTQTGDTAFMALKITPATGADSLDLGTYSLTNNGEAYVLFDGTYNPYEIKNGTLGSAGQPLTMHVAGTNALTVSAALGGGRQILSGTVGNNTTGWGSSYSGTLTIGERIYEDNHHNGEDRDCYVAARLAAEPARVATREDLLRLILPNSVVAEIGVFRGEFAERLLELCKPAELHLIDLWSGSATSGDKGGRNIVTVEDMEALYRGLCDHYRDMPQVHLHRGDSVEVLSRFPDRSLDAAYLDTTHHYDATIAELDVLAKKIRLDGWLMGHDYYPGCPAWQAVNEWCARTGQRVTQLTRDDGFASFAIALRQF